MRSESSLALILLTLPIFLHGPKAFADVLHLSRGLENDRAAERTTLSDARYLRQQSGLAICESLLLCHVSGHEFTLDPFNSYENIVTGRLDQKGLIGRVAHHEFSVIELTEEIAHDRTTSICEPIHFRHQVKRFTDEFLCTVDRFYQIDRRSRNGVFYVPR